ncbi:Hypothetical predicted protein [Cloeon dipterum]|uniref:C-type lectin domain-containing protein n=1 Tax=Cloeon dipterum TaxID=197152 RepID=A0A8S1DGX1_9INSE|nr:Hypothetical predicted protein [Cloeon dipterum]
MPWRNLLSLLILFHLTAALSTKKQEANEKAVLQSANLRPTAIGSKLLTKRREFIENCCSNTRCDSPSNTTLAAIKASKVFLLTTLAGSADPETTALLESSSTTPSTITTTPVADGAQCPEINCVINTAQQNEFRNQKAWGLISTGYVIYLCDKKYIHYNIPVTQSDAYLKCCQMGLKLASIATMADLHCVKGNFCEQLTWVASSINGSLSDPRWCTASGSYLLSDLTQKIPPPGPGIDAINMRLSDGTAMYDRASNLRWALCVDK